MAASEEFVHFLQFNQDQKCLSVGMKTGFRIYNTTPFSVRYKNKIGGVRIAEMLFSTSLVALVGSGDKASFSPRTLHIFDTTNNKPICEVNFVTAIRGVRLNRKRLIVVMESKIHIYDINTMKLLHTLETRLNTAGVCALSPSDNSYLAFPHLETGKITLYDAMRLQQIGSVLEAHMGSICCLRFSNNGNYLASASDKGTIIRVFEVPNNKKSFTFRRGSSPTVIYDIVFSGDNRMLAVTSKTGTVHIFKIDETTSHAASEGGLVSTYLPTFISEAWQPVRSFTVARLPIQGIVSTCAFTPDNPFLIVATRKGIVYNFQITDSEECTLREKHDLLGDNAALQMGASASSAPSPSSTSPLQRGGHSSSSGTTIPQVEE